MNNEESLLKYNKQLLQLGQNVYKKILKKKVDEINGEGSTYDLWFKLAHVVANEYATIDGIEYLDVPTKETVIKILKDEHLNKTIVEDEGNRRKLFPAYFDLFCTELRLTSEYSTIMNNIGVIYVNTQRQEKAREIFQESIDFVPEGVKYDEPQDNLRGLPVETKKLNECAMCGNVIGKFELQAFRTNFCSYACHLQYWKEEMPNLGGDLITDEDLEKINKMDKVEAGRFHSQVVARF